MQLNPRVCFGNRQCVSLPNLKESNPSLHRRKPVPGMYILHCSLDSGVRRKDGVGNAAQSGVHVDSTLALVY